MALTIVLAPFFVACRARRVVEQQAGDVRVGRFDPLIHVAFAFALVKGVTEKHIPFVGIMGSVASDAEDERVFHRFRRQEFGHFVELRAGEGGAGQEFA